MQYEDDVQVPYPTSMCRGVHPWLFSTVTAAQQVGDELCVPRHAGGLCA